MIGIIAPTMMVGDGSGDQPPDAILIRSPYTHPPLLKRRAGVRV
jgi:hypothetical protein